MTAGRETPHAYVQTGEGVGCCSCEREWPCPVLMGREATHAKVCRWLKGQQVDYDTQACNRCRQMAAPAREATP